MTFKATAAGAAHEPTLHCPSCNREIRLTESLAAPLLAETRQRFQEQLASKDAEVARKTEPLQQEREKLQKDLEQVEDQVASRLAAERSQLVATEAKKSPDSRPLQPLSFYRTFRTVPDPWYGTWCAD